jgi:hypothetical protein
MPRPATGQIVERRNASGGINRTLRFHAADKRRTMPLGEVPRDEAERQLRFVLADIARGTWKPAERTPSQPEVYEVPTFHEYAEEWWVLHEGTLAPKTRTDYRWRLEKHLLGYFGTMPLDVITLDSVERYIAGKLGQEEPLAPRSINMTVTLMGQSWRVPLSVS